jgi:hypothetical protein
MKKLTKRQRSYQVRRKTGLEKRRLRSKDKRRENRLRSISGEES